MGAKRRRSCCEPDREAESPWRGLPSALGLCAVMQLARTGWVTWVSPARWDNLLSLRPLPWEALGRTALSQGLLRVGQPAHALLCQGGRRLSHSTGPQGGQTNVSWGLWGEMRRCRQGASTRQGRRAVISARTRTLHAARCELVRSVLLIASPTAARRGRTRLRGCAYMKRVARGCGGTGARLSGSAPTVAQAPLFGTAPSLADALGGPRGERRGRHTGWNALTCNPAPDLSGTLCLHTRGHVTQPLPLP